MITTRSEVGRGSSNVPGEMAVGIRLLKAFVFHLFLVNVWDENDCMLSVGLRVEHHLRIT